MMVKQFEMTMDQIDAILVDELKEAVELNWNGDHELVEAAFKLLAYYMTADDFSAYREKLEEMPPPDSVYENYN
jgi:hypothetical protein